MLVPQETLSPRNPRMGKWDAYKDTQVIGWEIRPQDLSVSENGGHYTRFGIRWLFSRTWKKFVILNLPVLRPSYDYRHAGDRSGAVHSFEFQAPIVFVTSGVRWGEARWWSQICRGLQVFRHQLLTSKYSGVPGQRLDFTGKHEWKYGSSVWYISYFMASDIWIIHQVVAWKYMVFFPLFHSNG